MENNIMGHKAKSKIIYSEDAVRFLESLPKKVHKRIF